MLRGLRTLPLRVGAAQSNAGRLAELFERHEAVARVRYPGLVSHPHHALCRRQMAGGGAVLAIELAGGREPAIRFVEALEVATLAGSLGGLETLAMHPASMSHVHFTPDELSAADIPEGLVRIAVGCESYEDLAADVEKALARAAGAAGD